MPSPRRVLFIDHTARMGGGEVALLNLIAALDRTRHKPLALLFSDGPFREKLAAIGVETTVLPLAASIADARKETLGGGRSKFWRGLQLMAFIVKVRTAIHRAEVDLVHTNSLKADLIGGIAARLARRPVVWHVRDRIADDYLPPRVVKWFRAAARRIPTAIIANSRATLDTLTPTGDPPRVGRRPAWVVHDGTHVPPESAASSSDGQTIIGLVGRLAPWKGQNIFIEAAARVRRRFPEARFRIIGAALFGEDQYEQSLRRSIDALELQDAVSMVGFRADVDVAIAELDLLVHASTTGEPFGQVIIEGMAAGKPVVATRGGGVPEIVIDGETGLLVPMNDAAAMAEAIETLLMAADRRAAMGAAGRQRVEAQFTMTHVADNMQNIFDQI